MLIELVIWALDGTLFEASPGHGKTGAPIASRADMIRAFNSYGVASTICAQADAEAARAWLIAAGLWNELVLPRFDMAPEPDALRQVIADLALAPGEVLLVHHDASVLQAARAVMPDIRILNAAADDADPILEAIFVARRRPWKTRASIALLFGDQTRSVAHFSALRPRIDDDAALRRFTLSNMISGPMEETRFPATLVYGAGVDYEDGRWPDLADLLDDEGLLEACIHLFCERVAAASARMLVVLPSAGDLAIPTVQLRRRTIRFNAAWRDAALSHPNIEIMDLPQGLPGSAMQMRVLAGAIDDWVDGREAAQAKVA